MNERDVPSDLGRYPTLTEHGRTMLRFLREHPHAPRFRNESGNRLHAEDVRAVLEHEREVARAIVDRDALERPRWLDAFLTHCYDDVPCYRRLGPKPARLIDVPPIGRGELGRDIAQFVPDTVPIDRLINFQTTGTTGHALLLASHPRVAASYLAYHKRALRRRGIELCYGRGQVGVVLIGQQRNCFTYASVTPAMGDSGLAKINLHPDDWRAPDDRAKYLDALAPEVIAGDPISFDALLQLPVTCRPRAILSTSMALTGGLAARLEGRFACPVFDLYSLNEAGPVAVYDAACGGHVLLQHRLIVELLDPLGQPVAPGERGEITLTGGFNFCLPLLRYRTGDHASLAYTDRECVLVGLQGRPPVRFRTSRGGHGGGEWLNNIDVTHQLKRFAIAQYTLHQDRTGALSFRYQGSAADADLLAEALAALFGTEQALRVERVAAFDGKVVQYTSELESDGA